jgi:hypothetical protein
VVASAGEALPQPLEDPDELIMLFTLLMEDASDSLMLERALAGAVRLSNLPDRDRRGLVQPLEKRIRTKWSEDHHGPFSGRAITSDIALVAAAWGWGSWVERPRNPYVPRMANWTSVDASGQATRMDGILSARMWECSQMIRARVDLPLIAEPEYERGAVSGDRLLARVSDWAASGTSPGAYDLEQAILRLEPGVDGSFWSAWAAIDRTSASRARAIHEAAGQPLDLQPVFGTPQGRSPTRGYNFWRPHSLARLQNTPTSSSPLWGLLTAIGDPLGDHETLYGTTFGNRNYDPVVASWPLMCPWQPELASAHLLRALSDGLRPGPSPATAAVGALNHPGFALGPIGHLALVAGLSSAEPDTRIAAANAFTFAAIDGRLVPELAGEALARGVTEQVLMLNRVADALNHAQYEPLAAYRIVETVLAAGTSLIDNAPPNLHLLLELAARCAATVGAPAPPDALRWLADRKSKTKAVAAARRLMDGSTVSPVHRGEAARQALAGMIDTGHV